MRIVLDKSSLQALSARRISAICDAYQVLMPDVLFYELLTTVPAERAAIFRKIPQRERPFSLTADPGYLFGRELEARRPIDVILDSGLDDVRWQFNVRLGDPEWMPEQYRQITLEWREEIARQVESFRERAALVTHAFFPDLIDLRGGQLHRIEEISRSLSSDSQLVRDIFAHIAEQNGAQMPEGFGPTWIGYRLLQAELLWALEHAARYGSGVIDAPMPRLENYVCDMKYAVIASKCDGFVCHDNQARRLFSTMAPELISAMDLPVRDTE